MTEYQKTYYTPFETRELLKFYTGTPFQMTENETGKIHFVVCDDFGNWGFYGTDWQGQECTAEYPLEWTEIKLILRDPSDCNANQKQRLKELCHKVIDSTGKVLYYADTPASLKYGFQHSIDMFELIERGFAVDVMSLYRPIKEWAIKEHANKYQAIKSDKYIPFKPLTKLKKRGRKSVKISADYFDK